MLQGAFLPNFLSQKALIMLAPMAFTTVSARRTLVTPTIHGVSLANPAPTINSAPKKREWPPSVRAYVQRAFAEANIIAGVHKEEMETKLKEIISNAAENNSLTETNWHRLALPQQMIMDERNKAYLAKTNEQLSNSQVKSADIFGNGIPSRKRKSSGEPEKDRPEAKTPPWRITGKGGNAFEDRISYPEKRPRIEATGGAFSKSTVSIENRKKRFQDPATGYVPPSPFSSNENHSNSDFVDNGPIVGRCQILEKKYFRLTAPPNPDTVRPIHILEKTLALLKQKWKDERNYSYICDQFKSLRQDLTVQHIKTSFTVSVYEIHARIALERGDLGEYNQCQTQLRALYTLKLNGHATEFKAYRILYFIHTCNRTDMNDVLADLTPAEKMEGPIKHALETRSALALGNYHRFFQLYLATPNMGAYLMDMFVGRERLAALANICKA